MDTNGSNEFIFNTTFTLSFAIEIVGIDILHDCKEGWLDLGSFTQGLKISCSSENGWVRTWQFLDRRWFTFSIQHSLPANVIELKDFVVTVLTGTGVSSLGHNTKSDEKNLVYLPPLKFGDKRYFAKVLKEKETQFKVFLEELIWNELEKLMPWQGLFNIPYPVSDIRHQDAILYNIRDIILNKKTTEKVPQSSTKSTKQLRTAYASKRRLTDGYELSLSGIEILAGLGRIVPFEATNALPQGMGEVVVLMSTKNLPASNDLPILFVNVEKLTQIPVKELSNTGITEVYTSWGLGEENHQSKRISLETLTKSEEHKFIKSEIKFHDHYAIPLPYELGSNILASFIDDKFQIELHGIRPLDKSKVIPIFFGYDKKDRYYDKPIFEVTDEESSDVLIATCLVDASKLSKGINALIRGEYSLYPPKVEAVPCHRKAACTNDINRVRSPVKPISVVQPSIILEAQMNLEISLGFVGCKPPILSQSYSRFYCLVDAGNVEKISDILYEVTEINETLIAQGRRDEILTGYAIDTGNVAFIYIEGPRDGQILQIWEMTEDFYPSVKPLFSTSARYFCRIYPELLTVTLPFNVYKMYAPIGTILACPPVYVRPAVPLPAKSALMKLGHILAGNLAQPPGRDEMPTMVELKSFRLEFVVALKPTALWPSESQEPITSNSPIAHSTSLHKGKIYWQ